MKNAVGALTERPYRLLSLGFLRFEFFELLEFTIVCAVELIDVVAGERPTARSRHPGLREYLGILNGDLNDQVVH